MFGRSGSIQLARIFGIRIGVDVSWFIVLFFFIFILSGSFRTTLQSSDTTAYATAVASALLFFASLVLHELGHALVARRLGIEILGIDLWIARGLPRREVFALRAPIGWGRAAALGFGVFAVIWIVSIALGPLLHPDREQGLAPDHWEPAHAGAFALNLVALAVVGPIVEELTFRGLGYSLLRPYGLTTAILGIGVLFALWHGLVQALPVLFVFGAGLAYLRSRTDSVYPGMILHMLFNALALLIAVTL